MTYNSYTEESLIIKTLLRNCPICKCGQGQVLHTQTFLLADGNFLPSSYDVVCCVKCGFTFADTSANQADYDRYYQELSKYESIATASGSGITSYDLGRLEKTAEDIVKYFGDKNSNILDVGCANGGLLLEMKKLGYNNLSGLDPSPICINTINKTGFNGVIGGLYTNNNFAQKFDGILLTHVLEHVYDVRGAISNMFSWLKDKGKLYIEVPDSARYKDFSIIPYYFFDVEHINHFDKDSLYNLFRDYNCSILKVKQKDIPVSETNLYPAVYIVVQKIYEQPKIISELVLSTKAKKSILDHIKWSALKLVNHELEKLILDNKPIIIWGAGQATQRLLSNTSLGSANILFLVDNDEKKVGSMIKGKKVFSPKEIYRNDATVVICSALHNKEILQEIQLMKINNNIIIYS